MVKIKVVDILNERERNLLWLSKKCNLGYNTIYNFAMGKTNAVSYNVLEAVCRVLEVKLTDIIEFVDEETERSYGE